MLRLIVSVLVGAAVTFALFVLMAELISNSARPGEEPPPAPVIDVVMSEPDSSTQTRSRVPPPPPPPPKQPPKMEPQEPDAAEADADMNFDMPGVDVGGANVDISGPGALMRDGEATPVVRIEPKYPIEAARDGKEGWVRLSFTINEVGGVEDIEVIDAEPKRIFDREARRALSRWKYKPKVVEGKPVKQYNMKVQLDFKLEQ